MSEEKVESIFQYAREGAAVSIGSTRVLWQRVVDAIQFLRLERDEARKDAASCAAAHINAVAQLTEARRLLDDARAQKFPDSHLVRIDGICKTVRIEWGKAGKEMLSPLVTFDGTLSDMFRAIEQAKESVVGAIETNLANAAILSARHAAAPVPAQPAIIQHDSDCSLHNAPALPVGPCDCSKAQPAAVPLLVNEISDICNAYESGVGHRGRPTAKVNPYPKDTAEFYAYAMGAAGKGDAT